MSKRDDVLKIVRTLLAQTRDGSLQWGTNDTTLDDEYVGESERFLYYVGSRDNDGEPPYSLQVWRLMPGLEEGKSENLKLLDVVSLGEFAAVQAPMQELVELVRLKRAGLNESLADEIMQDFSQPF